MNAEIGIIGGSGLYSLLKDAEECNVDTKYGKTSSTISIGIMGGKKIAFIRRHGIKHTIPPHKVPYRANIDALSQLGVKRIIATNAVGSLSPNYKPGEIAIFDQFVNFTQGRTDTFYDENVVVHVSAADPYCPQLRDLASQISKKNKIPHHDSGTIAIINGPRFSTRAESRMFSSQGNHLIGMTQYPEVHLARERQICYVGLGLVTDYDSGLEGRSDIKPVSMAEVSKIFSKNVEKATTIINGMVAAMPSDRSCNCSKALDGASIA